MKGGHTIVFTHEHSARGRSRQRAGAIAPKVCMTREQLNGPKLKRGGFLAGTRA